jgi:hypothetical protein
MALLLAVQLLHQLIPGGNGHHEGLAVPALLPQGKAAQGTVEVGILIGVLELGREVGSGGEGAAVGFARELGAAVSVVARLGGRVDDGIGLVVAIAAVAKLLLGDGSVVMEGGDGQREPRGGVKLHPSLLLRSRGVVLITFFFDYICKIKPILSGRERALQGSILRSVSISTMTKYVTGCSTNPFGFIDSTKRWQR